MHSTRCRFGGLPWRGHALRAWKLKSVAMVAAWLGAAVLVAPSAAVPINYGNFMGNTVIYTNVSEDSGPLPLFGAPNVSGDSIDFNPLGFEASSAGVNSATTIGNLTFGVAAKPGSAIDRLTLTEAGDTTLAGNVPPGSLDTSAAVFVSGVLDIHEVDFSGITNISVPFAMTFSPSGGTYFLGTDGGGGPVFHTQWGGSVTLDIEAILIANSVPMVNGATSISINLNNTLVAVSQSGTTASIAKKDFSGITITIPEPTTVGWATLALVAVRRRRAR